MNVSGMSGFYIIQFIIYYFMYFVIWYRIKFTLFLKMSFGSDIIERTYCEPEIYYVNLTKEEELN